MPNKNPEEFKPFDTPQLIPSGSVVTLPKLSIKDGILVDEQGQNVVIVQNYTDMNGCSRSAKFMLCYVENHDSNFVGMFYPSWLYNRFYSPHGTVIDFARKLNGTLNETLVAISNKGPFRFTIKYYSDGKKGYCLDFVK